MRRRTARQPQGNFLGEYAVSLFMLILLLFFPLLNMIGLATVYCAALVLVDQQCHEAALLFWRDAKRADGPVCKNIPEDWLATGIGAFTKTVGTIETEINYSDGIPDEYGFVSREVIIATRLTVSPFLNCPFPVAVPGINAPVPLVIAGRRLIEDPTNAP